jgi:predicted nucleic acid-binding protein
VILVDTSAWAEFDRASGSAVDHRLSGLIGDRAGIAVTEPVVMEVLRRARDAEAGGRLRRLLLSFGFVPLDPVADFDGAALLHHRCLAAGFRPRHAVDCLTVSVAWRAGVSLLAHDPVLCRMATVAGVALDEASPKA